MQMRKQWHFWAWSADGKKTRWTVKQKNNLTNDDGERLDGLCDQGKKIVYFDAGLNSYELLQVLLHESQHVVADKWDEDAIEDSERTQVGILAPVIMQIADGWDDIDMEDASGKH